MWSNNVVVFDGGELGGELSDDSIRSKEVVQSLLAPFLNPEHSKQSAGERMRIIEAHDDVARRMFAVRQLGISTFSLANQRAN